MGYHRNYRNPAPERAAEWLRAEAEKAGVEYRRDGVTVSLRMPWHRSPKTALPSWGEHDGWTHYDVSTIVWNVPDTENSPQNATSEDLRVLARHLWG